MPRTLAEKIIAAHLVGGTMAPGAEIALKIDQTLTQDATGTMAYLEFEALGLARVKTELSVAYVDHNMLQCDFMNADDHRYLQSVAARHGIWFSRPGNGICHQVHLERFGRPGKTLVGSDSHTPTAGGLGMLAFGAGGMDVAVAMGGGAYRLAMPRILRVNLRGRLRPFVSAKDVALELLRRLSVKGGVGAIVEWSGPGVETLSVPERATITNMGAELGATTSIFPSDARTREFLAAQGREEAFVPLAADPDAQFAETIEIDLDGLEPLVACPHSPDNVKRVADLTDVKVDQVCIGSCTNSSLADLWKVAAILRGRTIATGVSLGISPGSRQTLSMLAAGGELNDLLASGARLLECACGPCIGMGFSPPSRGVSVRTFNRNFQGRSGTADAGVYLVSPETAAATALAGHLADPRGLDPIAVSALPSRYVVDDRSVLAPPPPDDAAKVEVVRGPNIRPCPIGAPLPESLVAKVVLKVGDNITTDHIMPAGAKVLPYRSNIPKMGDFCFGAVDPGFPARARRAGCGVIVGGENYGQGSSREHAALVPFSLGVRAVVAKSFARIHAANLINAGILPLVFVDPADSEALALDDKVELTALGEGLSSGHFTLVNRTRGVEVALAGVYSAYQQKILRAGGLLAATKEGLV